MKQLLIQLNNDISDNIELLLYGINNRCNYDRIVVFSDKKSKIEIFFRYFKLKNTDVFYNLSADEGDLLAIKLNDYNNNKYLNIVQNIEYDENDTDYLRKLTDVVLDNNYIKSIKENFYINLPENIIADFNKESIKYGLMKKCNIIMRIQNMHLIESDMFKQFFPEFYKATLNNRNNVSLYIDNNAVFEQELKKYFDNDTYVYCNLKSEKLEESIEDYIYVLYKDEDMAYTSLIEDQLKYLYYTSKLNNVYIFPNSLFYLNNLFR